MRIELHLYDHGCQDDTPWWAIAILNKLEIIMSELTDQLDALEANTTAIDGSAASAESAFTELAALIATLKTSQTDPATAARIKAVSDALATRAASLGAAVAGYAEVLRLPEMPGGRPRAPPGSP